MNDNETIMEIQTSKDVSDTGMALPQEVPPKLGPENDEEQNPLQYLPDGSTQQVEQYEMVPIDQIEYLTGPQIIHQYTNLLCCYYYKQIRRIKKKEDIEAGKPNKITRVIEAKEWLLGLEPASDELYVWTLKASLWTFVASALMIICTKLLIGFYLLFFGSDRYWTELSNVAVMIPVLGGFFLWQRRIVKTALKKNDLSEARKQFKICFIALPYSMGFFFALYTLPFAKI